MDRIYVSYTLKNLFLTLGGLKKQLVTNFEIFKDFHCTMNSVTLSQRNNMRVENKFVCIESITEIFSGYLSVLY